MVKHMLRTNTPHSLESPVQSGKFFPSSAPLFPLLTALYFHSNQSMFAVAKCGVFLFIYF